MRFEYLSKLTNFISPELLHKFFIFLLRTKLIKNSINSSRLKINLWDIEFQNPLGLAAGFDKNAEVIKGCLDLGFGFVEVGTVTPKPQIGNNKPRIFKIPEFQAVIQRLGFNNLGVKNFTQNIKNYRNFNEPGIVGSNIGKNKSTISDVEDYLSLLDDCIHLSDYIVINVSSPNTPGLRNLQKKENITKILKNINLRKTKSVPILLKISPDIEENDLEYICEIALKKKWLDGLIVSNTTILRDMLKKKPIKNSWKIEEEGGLSGPPLFQKSTEILKKTFFLTKGKVPIIGVGGISNSEEAFEKILSGASLIQIYTSMIYNGPNIVIKILNGLDKKLKKNGFKNISEAIGQKVKL